MKKLFTFFTTVAVAAIGLALVGTVHADTLIVSNMLPDPTTNYGGNWDVTQGVGGPSGFSRFMDFTTGNFTDTISQLQVYASTSGTAPKAVLYASSNNNPLSGLPTGSPLLTFSGVGPFVGVAPSILTPDSTYTLAADTTYWLAYEGDASAGGAWGAEYSENPVVTGETGATITYVPGGVIADSADPLSNPRYGGDPVDYLFALYAAPAETSSVPEPSTFVLAGLGLVGLGCVALRKKLRRA